MISPEVIDYLKDQVNIVDVVSKYIEVSKNGFKFSAECPFCHAEGKTLEVSAERQFFRCSKCNSGGNVFTFIQKHEKLSFPNAVKKVSEIAGLDFASVVKEKDTSLHLVVMGTDEENEKLIRFLDENKIRYIKNK